MRYFIIAGEASGDLHASNLMRELKNKDSVAEFCFLGGDLMAAQGGKMIKHYREMAFMGFLAVLKNAGTILNNLKIIIADKQTHDKFEFTMNGIFRNLQIRKKEFESLSAFSETLLSKLATIEN